MCKQQLVDAQGRDWPPKYRFKLQYCPAPEYKTGFGFSAETVMAHEVTALLLMAGLTSCHLFGLVGA